MSYEQYVIRTLWKIHKSPRDHIDGLLGSPRDYEIFDRMLQDGSLRGDFRRQGFTTNSMHSPRHPITAPISDDKRRSEENMAKVFGKSSVHDPDRAHHPDMGSMDANWTAARGNGASHRTGQGFQYGGDAIDNSPRQRGKTNMLHGSPSGGESRPYQQMRQEADNDIFKFKQEKMMQDSKREQVKQKDMDMQTKYYPWDRLNQGHGAPKGDYDNRRRKFLETDSPSAANPVMNNRETSKHPRGHDLFVTTLGGPGGTVVRENGGPSLQSMPDPRMAGAYRSPLPNGHQREAELAVRVREIDEQSHRIGDLKQQLEILKSPQRTEARDQDRYQPGRSHYAPSFGTNESTPSRGQRNHYDADDVRPHDKRSLDLEATRGGAGAPLRDDRGKAITRFPVTMGRDDSGATRIRETIPGKSYNLPEDPVYDPFGKPGGGAPMVDRQGRKTTNTFGNFEYRTDSADMAKRARAKEVIMHDLRVGIEEQQRNKERDTEYQRAPPGELAELMRAKEVGRPKVDPITGALANQHLPNSDVSRVKMNYQPKDEVETRHYQEALREQMEDNERNRQLNILRNKHESDKHFEQFDQNWGHLGGGGPKNRSMRKKINLDNALYHYDRDSRNEDSPVNSKSQYVGLQAAPKPVHESNAPFATGSSHAY